MAVVNIRNNLKFLFLRFAVIVFYIILIYIVVSIYQSKKAKRVIIPQNYSDSNIRDLLNEPATQDDPYIVDILRKNVIPPSSNPINLLPNNRTKRKWELFSKYVPKVDHEVIKTAIKTILGKYIDTKNMTGFFIECGTNDGEKLSNSTLQSEMDFKWTGLIVEAKSDKNKEFAKLKTKNRKAWLLNTCLSPVPYTSKFTFYIDPKENGSGNSGPNYRRDYVDTENTTVQCFPLYSVLVALNVTMVDYISLDIDGKELNVLKTIPFDKITFKVLTIEQWVIPGGEALLQSL